LQQQTNDDANDCPMAQLQMAQLQIQMQPQALSRAPSRVIARLHVPWQRLQKLLAKVKESTIIHNVSIFNKYS
jgi:hypothetical protein